MSSENSRESARVSGDEIARGALAEFARLFNAGEFFEAHEKVDRG